MRQTLFQYRDGDTATYIYKNVNPFYVLLKKFVTHKKPKKVTFRLDNLYVCQIKSLCNHPNGIEMGNKILWANNGSYLDPTTGNRYIYDDDLEDYINIGDRTILERLSMKLEDVRGVKKKYPQYLSIKQIADLNEEIK